MFWKKKIEISKPLEFETTKDESRDSSPYPERHCWLYISSRYNEILFVPMGKIDNWTSRELDCVITGKWPMNIGELQENIKLTLDQWQPSVDDIKPSNENWHSFNSSKAKTQKSFKVDYVQFSLTTDVEKKYGQGEVERIIIKSSPLNWNEDNYKIIGKNHLLETQVAQVVIDIFKACNKIRTI